MQTYSKDILALLKENARTSNNELAIKLGTTPETVASCIKDLENDGVIVRYTTIVNENKLKHPPQKLVAAIEVQVKPEKKTGFENPAKRIARYPNVIDQFLVSGTYDFLVLVEGSTLEEIASFVSDKLSPIEQVTGTTTHFILKKYKSNGIPLEVEESLERLLVTP